MPHLVLYGRAGCHLCEEMAAELARLQPESGFSFGIVDVDTDPRLAERYGSLVPVLTLAGQEVCHYFLDPEALYRHLRD